MLDLYEQNTDDNIVISEAEICDRYSAFTSPLIEGVPTLSSNGTNKVIFTGHIDWEIDDDPINNKPKLDMRNVLIEIGIKNWWEFNKIASGYTDENGNYEIVIDSDDWVNNEDIYFRICLEGKTFEVSTFWFFPHYYYEYNLGEVATIGSTVNYNVKIKCEKNEDVYKATYIHQAMTIAERFAEEMGFESDNFIRVAFPAESITVPIDGVDYSLSDMAFCYGDFWDNCICAIGINSWQRTETMVHEYSHYIQCSMGNYGEELTEILYENPNHDGISDYYAQKGDKSFAMHLSWTEGWGEVFAVMAQKYYQSEYLGLNNYTTHIDTTVKTYNHDDYIGEFQEKSVKAFLWNLFDRYYASIPETETTDYNIPWTPQEWWNMTTVSGTYRLHDFIKLIEDEAYNVESFANLPDGETITIDYSQLKKDFSVYLSEFNISPNIVDITYDTDDVSVIPQIKLQVNGSNQYPNNTLSVRIYDTNNELLAQSENISVNAGNFDEYTLASELILSTWNEAISKCHCSNGEEITLQISVSGHRYDEVDDVPMTGPYYSNYYQLRVVIPHKYGYYSQDETYHTISCDDCGHQEAILAHNFVCESLNDQYHKIECSDCGYDLGTYLHTLKSSNERPNSKQCSGCGAWIYTGGGGGGIYPIFPSKKPDIDTEPV